MEKGLTLTIGFFIDDYMSQHNIRDRDALNDSLAALEADAFNFATRYINDPSVRQNYIKNIKKLCIEYRQRVRIGELTPKTAAEQVAVLRNRIMEASRLKLSDIGYHYSTKKKEFGKALPELLERYAMKYFNSPFDRLNTSQQSKVYLEIIESAGRDRVDVSRSARRLSALGRGLLLVTLGVAVYNITNSEDKINAMAREGVTIGGGFAAGAAGGAVAGMVCGPASPVCVAIGVFIGGALGALGANVAFDWLF